MWFWLSCASPTVEVELPVVYEAIAVNDIGQYRVLRLPASGDGVQLPGREATRDLAEVDAARSWAATCSELAAFVQHDLDLAVGPPTEGKRRIVSVELGPSEREPAVRLRSTGGGWTIEGTPTQNDTDLLFQVTRRLRRATWKSVVVRPSPKDRWDAVLAGIAVALRGGAGEVRLAPCP